MLIRRALPGEYDEVGAATLAAYAPFTLGEGDPYSERLRDAAARDREAELWVAVDERGQLLGSVTLCPPGSSWRELAGDDEGEFRMLAVSPAAQGRGVGEALVRWCLDHFAAVGAAAVVICSLDEMSAAHRLYARLGFVRLPERDWRPLPHVHLVAFRKEMSQWSTT